jgi:serine/threonine-protein kinase
MSTFTVQPPPLNPDGSDLSGRTLGDYLLLRRLGQGGMGQVYLAEQVSLKRKVALKLLRPELSSNKQALARFQAEAVAVAKATHANIVQVYEIGEHQGIPYMALEYVEGRNLKEYLNRKGPPELLVALSIMRQVASALQRAGELGIVHRDIKPENILLTRKGEVKVADFGLSRDPAAGGQALNLTQPGVTMGTPLYMSPEQVEGKAVDPRSDIYSFGVTCYHMLAGQPPFRGANAFEVAVQHVQKQPVPLTRVRPDLPEPLCAVVHKMMAKDPAQRHQTGRELLRDIVRLRELLGGSSPVQPTLQIETVLPIAESPAPEAPPRPAWSHPRWLVPAAVVLSILVAAGSGVALGWKKRSSARTAAQQEAKPADAGTIEAICLPNKREQTLRDAAEQYLNPPVGKTTDLAGGFGVCMDLGLFYLDEDRLDDAEKLFTRLDGFREPRSYKLLGRLGRSIVLGLRSRARESNALLHDVFPPIKGRMTKKDGREGLPPAMVRRIAELLAPIKPVLDSPNWRFWIFRARWYNYKNGVPEKDVPRFVVNRFPLRAGAEPLEPALKPGNKPGQGKQAKR